MRGLLLRGRIWMLSAVSGGTLLALSGCDPTVRDTVLGGVETASTTLLSTFIRAFFESVISRSDDNSVTTVRAFIDHAHQLFA
jgi:hypothetical protein